MARLDENDMVDITRKFSRVFDSNSETISFADFDWMKIPETIPGGWLVYFRMLEDFSRIVANNINTLGYYCEKMRVWNIVLEDYNVDLRDEILFEFVDPLCVVALNLPYAIRCRFIFAIAHLCHQANRAISSKWIDNIDTLAEDRKIDFGIAYKVARKWTIRDRLFEAIKALFDENHAEITKDFRHTYNHRMPSQEIVGVAAFVKREIGSVGKVHYKFGAAPRLDLTKMSGELMAEFRKELLAFERFKELVHEQTQAIGCS